MRLCKRINKRIERESLKVKRDELYVVIIWYVRFEIVINWKERRDFR